MSTQVKRVARPVRPKAVVAENTSVAEPEIKKEIKTELEQVEQDEVLEDLQVAPTKRQQTSKALGVSISSARVRRHIDRLNLNHNLDNLLGEVKASIEECKKVDEADPKLHDLELKATALSRERTRFSNEASIALSIICDEIVQQLTEHTMNRVLAAKKKIIQVSHLHEAGVEKLPLFPLIKTLPSFVATANKIAADSESTKVADALSSALAQAEKDFKKKWSVKCPKVKGEEAALEVLEHAEEHPAEPEEDDASDSKTSFKFYVGQVCKETIKRDERYKSVRVSTEIRSYLSDLLVEFIKRLSNLVQLTANCMKNKTINDIAILRTVESLLIDGHYPVETVEIKEDECVDPVSLKAELQKKDDAKKAGGEYKFDLESLPKVKNLVAVRTVSYPTSGFAELSDKVHEKLSLHDSLVRKGKVLPDVEA